MTLGDGADILVAVVAPGGGYGTCPEVAGRFEQGAAQVVIVAL
jgi:hypothetical protein